jgi:hypothetical protein
MGENYCLLTFSVKAELSLCCLHLVSLWATRRVAGAWYGPLVGAVRSPDTHSTCSQVALCLLSCPVGTQLSPGHLSSLTCLNGCGDASAWEGVGVGGPSSQPHWSWKGEEGVTLGDGHAGLTTASSGRTRLLPMCLSVNVGVRRLGLTGTPLHQKLEGKALALRSDTPSAWAMEACLAPTAVSSLHCHPGEPHLRQDPG